MATPRKTPTKKAPVRSRPVAASGASRTAASWRKRPAADGHEITVPSGNVALVRRPGPEMFISAGKIPDVLTPAVTESIRKKQGLPPEKVAEIAQTPGMLASSMEMVNAAVVAAVIEPAVRADPPCSAEGCGSSPYAAVHLDSKVRGYHDYAGGNEIPESERTPDFLYVSEVDLTDRMFIFNYAVGGSSDLERFRREFDELVGGVDLVASNGDDSG